jgi:tetratricopeptide (TPR) repeat protein
MKGLISKVVVVAVFCASMAALAAAQNLGSVRGSCKDVQGNPIVGAEILWKNQNNGRTYKLKTDKKGNYFSLGIDPGDYTVTLSQNGKVLSEDKGIHVGLDELTHDMNMKQQAAENVAATAKKEGKSSTEVQQQVEKQQAEIAKAQKFNETAKVVNEKLNAADAFMKDKNYPQAISTLQEAATILPNNDVVLYRLGRGYMESAKAQTDAAERTKQNTEAYTDLQKAVDLKKAEPASTDAAKAQRDKENLAGYYDSLGTAAARLGKTDEAVNDYKQAVELNPTAAAGYYFNLGAILTNSATDANGKKAAAEAFDKAIAADPTRADAYYWKATNLMALATEKDGKLNPPDGTVEAFQKYLDLQPTGPHAEDAKQMLAAMNAAIKSSYGTQRPDKTKKK